MHMKRLAAALFVMPIILTVIVVGCTDTKHVDNPSLHIPIQLKLGHTGSPLGPIRIQSGQLIALPLCCPPVELRDANGRKIRELDSTQQPQPLVARPANAIVGHDPAGNERILKLKVTKD
jgi:hypothetical protein